MTTSRSTTPGTTNSCMGSTSNPGIASKTPWPVPRSASGLSSPCMHARFPCRRSLDACPRGLLRLRICPPLPRLAPLVVQDICLHIEELFPEVFQVELPPGDPEMADAYCHDHYHWL